MKNVNVQKAIKAYQAGKLVIICDNADRENEGDLALAAEMVTPQMINFMAKHGRGLICLALTDERCNELALPPMVEENTSQFGTAFTVSIEAKKGVTTGISAHDRSHTILTAIDPLSKPGDLVRPGHVFPLRAQSGGVLARSGQTEGSTDLARLAGMKPASVICEIMKNDGTMARLPELRRFSKRHKIPIVTVAELISYRLQRESLIQEVARADLPNIHGKDFDVRVFETWVNDFQHVALVHGTIKPNVPTLVRVHSECFTGDVLGSLRCDCRDQLQRSISLISKAKAGVLVYLRQEGRGIGFVNKVKAYALQDQGLDTVEANEKLGFKPDLREYGVGAQILKALGIKKMRLLTNNPRKIVGLDGFDLEIVERVPIEIPANKENFHYLETKRKRMGHILRAVK